MNLFGAFLHWGPSSPRGRTAIALMEEIHARFTITDEQKRYALATLIFEAERVGRHLGFKPLTPGQREATWRFWRGVAAQMPLDGLPSTADDLWRWMHDYEREHWHYTQAGREVVDKFFEDWTTRWFPRRTRALGRQVILVLLGRDLRSAPRLEEPGRSTMGMMRSSARLYLPLTLIRPLPTDRPWMDFFDGPFSR